MKIGQAYRYDNKIIVPLTEKTLDNQIFALVMNYDADSWDELKSQPIFEAAKNYTAINQVNNLKKAQTYLENTNVDGHISFEMMTMTVMEEQKVKSTYQSSQEFELGVGDRFVEGKNPLEYMVLGFFQRETKFFAYGVGAKTEKRNYPFATNFDAIINYVNLAAKTKDGLGILFTDNNLSRPLKADKKDDLQKLFFTNSKLPFWSINQKRESNVYYLKQEKPKVTELKPIKFIASEGKQKTLSKIGGFDIFNKITLRQRFFELSYELRQKILDIQEQNYEDIIIPEIKGTGNVFLDNFVILTDLNTNTPDIQYNYGNFSDTLLFGFTTKKELTANGEIFQYGAVYTASNEQINLFDNGSIKNCYTIYDYYSLHSFTEQIEKPFLTSGTIPRFNYASVTMNRSYSVHPPVFYLGQGRFSCLQNNEAVTDNDKYGVGDTFDLAGINYTLVSMSQGYDKKGNKVFFGDCYTTESLQGAVDNISTATLVRSPLTIPFIDAHCQNHISAFDIRKQIKDAYLQETVVGKKVSRFQEYKDILGEEYDDEFLAIIASLDWAKISEIQKKDARVIEPIKEIIKKSYADYIIEKAEKGKLKVKSVPTSKSVKFYWSGDNDSGRSLIARNITDKYGEEFADSSYLGKPKNAAPNIDIENIGEQLSYLIGNVIDWQRYSKSGFTLQTSIITCQEKNEPLLALPIKTALDTGDGESKYQSPVMSDVSNSFTYRLNYIIEGGDYFHLYFGDTIMYYLWALHSIQKEGEDWIPKTKKPKVFPFVLNDLGINLLRYMNRFGIFTTVEDMFNRLEAVLAKGDGSFGEPKEWFYMLFTSQSTTYAIGHVEKQKIIAKGLSDFSGKANSAGTFLSEKEKVIEYLNSLPIDWGNTDAPFMENSIAAPPTAPTKKKRTPKQTTTPPNPPTAQRNEFEWIDDEFKTFLSQDALEKFKAKFGYESTNLIIKKRSFNANYPTKTSDTRNFYLLLFEGQFDVTNELETEIFNPLYEIEEDIDFDVMQSNYPELQAQIEELNNNPSTWQAVFYIDFEHLTDAIDIIIKDDGTTTTTTPPPTPPQHTHTIQTIELNYDEPRPIDKVFQIDGKPIGNDNERAVQKNFDEIDTLLFGNKKELFSKIRLWTYPLKNGNDSDLYFLSIDYPSSYRNTNLSNRNKREYINDIEEIYSLEGYRDKQKELLQEYEYLDEQMAVIYGNAKSTDMKYLFPIEGYDNMQHFIEYIYSYLNEVREGIQSSAASSTKQFSWNGSWEINTTPQDKMDAFNKKYKFADDNNLSYTNFDVGGDRYTIYVFDKLTPKTNSNAIFDAVEGISLDLTEFDKLLNDYPKIEDDILSTTNTPNLTIITKFENSTKVAKAFSDLIDDAYNSQKQPKQAKQPKQPKQPRKSKKEKALEDAIEKLKNTSFDDI